MYGYFVCMCSVYYMEVRRGHQILGTGVTDGCTLLHECLEIESEFSVRAAGALSC